MSKPVTNHPSSLVVALEVAVRAARGAARPLLRHFRQPTLEVERKADGSLVSQADLQAEELVRSVLRKSFADVDILGEEGGLQGGGSRLRWLVDPLDGTLAYLAGMPLWGTLVALVDHVDDVPLVGVINLPTLGETYSAARGLGCFCNGKRIRIGPPVSVGGSPARPPVVSASDPHQFDSAECAADHARLAQSPIFRGHSDCFGHAMVLRGAVDVHVDPGLMPWDIAATRVLIPEAGGSLLLRESTKDGAVDALMGRPELSRDIARELGWSGDWTGAER